MSKKILDTYRLFDPITEVRDAAYEIYSEIKNLPIISLNSHINVKRLSENTPYQNPTALFISSSTNVTRMLYSHGIPMEDMGIKKKNNAQETDPKIVWKLFADNIHLFSGTSTGISLQYILSEVFGIEDKLNSNNADEFYDTIEKKLLEKDFLPRAMFDAFNIEVLATNNRLTDFLQAYKDIHNSDWNGKVIPTFRPDPIVNIISPIWKRELETLTETSGIEIHNYETFIQAIEERRCYFKLMGATSTDIDVVSPLAHRLNPDEAENMFQRAMEGKTSAEDNLFFTAHMIMEMARMSKADGLVMQIHPGSFRNHNKEIAQSFGTDKGCDIPMQAEFTKNLFELLNTYGNDPELSIIIHALDESSLTRELAVMAGHYPALKIGSPWWFLSGPEGMRRYRTNITEIAGIYNTIGFADEARVLPAIPARHDIFRRMEANYLANLVCKKIIDMDDAKVLAKALAYDLMKKAYKL